jgi:alginate O-acetyltransferase complex protein AlgI
MSLGWIHLACLVAAGLLWALKGRWRGLGLLAISLAWWSFASLEAIGTVFAVLFVTWVGAQWIHRMPLERRLLPVSVSIGMVMTPLLIHKLFVQGPQPLGISYYTFSAIAYLLDVNWGKMPPMSVSKLAFLGLFFPKAEAGPVERALPMSHSYDALAGLEWNHSKARHAVFLIAVGLFMKFVIASRLVLLVDGGYAAAEKGTSGVLLSLATIAAFPWQVYYDFCGYSLIALGMGALAGIPLINNFARPFFATSVSEFWSKWHISLSSWFRDYYFTPIRFMLRRHRRASVLIATISSFVLIGLWHDVGWCFVLLGVSHGLAVSYEAFHGGIQRTAKATGYLRRLYQFRTLAFVSVTLVLFRAGTLDGVREISLALLKISMESDLSVVFAALNKVDWLILLPAVLAIELCTKQSLFETKEGPKVLEGTSRPLRWLGYSSLTAVTLLFGKFEHTPFLYGGF